MSAELHRRALLGAAASLAAITPAWAAPQGATGAGADVLSGEDITLVIGWTEVVVAGRRTRAVTVNGRFPAPLIRLREGQDVRLRLVNTLDEDTSIHWHGLLLPWTMDASTRCTSSSAKEARPASSRCDLKTSVCSN